MSDDTPSHCASCGGRQLSWRLHRTATRNVLHSPREILWSCRGCGYEWREPLEVEPDSPPPLAS